MTGRDVGDQVAGLLVAVADRHDGEGCVCPTDDVAVDPVCTAAVDLADEIEATP